jgi:hypothetical protein
VRPVVALVVAFGCSSSAPPEPAASSTSSICGGAAIRCPAEPRGTLADLIDDCERNERDRRCRASFRARFECEQRNQVCDDGGRIDLSATEARCRRQADAWATCLFGPAEGP